MARGERQKLNGAIKPTTLLAREESYPVEPQRPPLSSFPVAMQSS
jgi:hypothetical protein